MGAPCRVDEGARFAMTFLLFVAGPFLVLVRGPFFAEADATQVAACGGATGAFGECVALALAAVRPCFVGHGSGPLLFLNRVEE